MQSTNVIGYKYQTEEEAQAAVTACNTYYGIPVSPNDVTQNWCMYQYANLNSPSFWYIVFDDSLQIVFGNSIEFEVNFEI